MLRVKIILIEPFDIFSVFVNVVRTIFLFYFTSLNNTAFINNNNKHR